MSAAFSRICYTFLVCMLGFLLFTACSSSSYLIVQEAKEEMAVRVFMVDGEVFEGLIIKRSPSELILINEEDHQSHTLQINDIRRVEKSDNNYDFSANLISDAEIQKYKSSRNAWGYAIGGAVLGGVFGIAIGLPFWYADLGIAPFFPGGIGLTAGSIFFGVRGIQKDRELAVEKVRFLRLQNQKKEEERRLEEIRKETEALKKKLSEKDKK